MDVSHCMSRLRSDLKNTLSGNMDVIDFDALMAV